MEGFVSVKILRKGFLTIIWHSHSHSVLLHNHYTLWRVVVIRRWPSVTWCEQCCEVKSVTSSSQPPRGLDPVTFSSTNYNFTRQIWSETTNIGSGTPRYSPSSAHCPGSQGGWCRSRWAQRRSLGKREASHCRSTEILEENQTDF